MLDTDDCVVISLNKAKLFLLALTAVGFVGIGVWLFVDPSATLLSPFKVQVVGLVAVGFSGLSFASSVAKIFDDRAGLVIDQKGIIDNSSAVAAGRVGWNEIREIRIRSYRNHRFLVLLVNNPQRYLGRGNLIRQYFVNANARLAGSPITISASALDIGFGELEALMRRYWAKYRASAPQPSSPRGR